MPIVEAMRAGTPVLTSNNSSNAEIGGSAALLVDPVSVDPIAEGMHRITSDTALRTMLLTAGQARGECFNWATSP
jgi:alpha-1,3-rhamnosyl/mannosyltransferase